MVGDGMCHLIAAQGEGQERQRKKPRERQAKSIVSASLPQHASTCCNMRRDVAAVLHDRVPGSGRAAAAAGTASAGSARAAAARGARAAAQSAPKSRRRSRRVREKVSELVRSP